MAISSVHQEAYSRAPGFQEQVHRLVRMQAQEWWALVPTSDPQYDILRQQYAQVSQNPQSYGFVDSIVADADWNSTYDPWAANPDSLRTVIEAMIEKLWFLRTGITPPAVHVLTQEGTE